MVLVRCLVKLTIALRNNVLIAMQLLLNEVIVKVTLTRLVSYLCTDVRHNYFSLFF